MADYARRQADQARQAQALMERIRTLGAGIDSLTWRRLASGRGGGTDAVVSEGLGHYKQLTASLRRLRALGVPRSRTADGRAAPRRGLRRGNAGTARLPDATPRWAAGSQRRRFAPAMRRFDAAIAAPRRRPGRHCARGAAAHLARLARFARRSACCCSACSAGGCTGSSGGPRSPSRRATPSAAARSDCTRSSATPPTSSPSSTARSRVRWVAESVRSALGYDPAVVDRRPVDGARPRRRRRRRDALPGEGRA